MKTLLRRLGHVFLGLHHRAPIVTIGVMLPLVYLLVLTAPLHTLTSMFDHLPGVTSTETAIHLPTPALGLLVIAGCLTALGSVLVGGLAKWMYRDLGSRGVLIIHLFAGAGAFLVCASMIRDVTPAFNHAREADNAWVLSYLGFWLLMVGYMLKAPWDDARDRVNTWLEQASVSEQSQSPTGTENSQRQDL
ncbi:MAG: hypothetical protein EOO77_21525 [Oxalobacteraceae bacterium]|nr:MAG: hypothetical protein EOO77_21525 [Oxalobacteraceae bacterium]